MRYRLTILLLYISAICLQAQNLNQAKTWFLQGKYEKALPVFKNAILQKPGDASLHYWYGVCLLETGKSRASVPYLKFASTRRIQQADRSLAICYLKLGAPDTSLTYIDKYLSNTSLTQANRGEALKLKDSIQHAFSQFQHVEDVLFIDSVIVPMKNLYTSFSLSKESGKLIQTHTLFPRLAASYGHTYIPERNDRAYYADSIPGKGLDLIARNRILDGWDTPEVLPDCINSTGNELNPFMLQDGITLYYASDGPGSIGGLDLFVTRLNPSSKSYLLPDHLNRPFNSPANDYFLVIDETLNRGYLATDRHTKKGYVTIYTFIPTVEKTFLKDKSQKELEDFAQIRSIRATWAGKNVDSLLHAQRPVKQAATKAGTNPEGNFQFYINDSTTYTSLSAFQSDEARQLYQQYLTKQYNLTVNQKALDEKRLKYQTASGDIKTRLGNEILAIETMLASIQKELPALEVSARNLEIKALSK
ncbi:MAG: hypothetical protein Q8914_10925 [Bacteroidota bacterium]|nr:hypothetical protein [Bacteroidota bacterium]